MENLYSINRNLNIYILNLRTYFNVAIKKGVPFAWAYYYAIIHIDYNSNNDDGGDNKRCSCRRYCCCCQWCCSQHLSLYSPLASASTRHALHIQVFQSYICAYIHTYKHNLCNILTKQIKTPRSQVCSRPHVI